jgi:hypothetical protein
VLTVVDADGRTPNGALIDEIVREGARRMLAAALEAEVNIYLESARDRWRAGNAPRLVALVRAGARFGRGIPGERDTAVGA